MRSIVRRCAAAVVFLEASSIRGITSELPVTGAEQ